MMITGVATTGGAQATGGTILAPITEFIGTTTDGTTVVVTSDGVTTLGLTGGTLSTAGAAAETAVTGTTVAAGTTVTISGLLAATAAVAGVGVVVGGIGYGLVQEWKYFHPADPAWVVGDLPGASTHYGSGYWVLGNTALSGSAGDSSTPGTDSITQGDNASNYHQVLVSGGVAHGATSGTLHVHHEAYFHSYWTDYGNTYSMGGGLECVDGTSFEGSGSVTATNSGVPFDYDITNDVADCAGHGGAWFAYNWGPGHLAGPAVQSPAYYFGTSPTSPTLRAVTSTTACSDGHSVSTTATYDPTVAGTTSLPVPVCPSGSRPVGGGITDTDGTTTTVVANIPTQPTWADPPANSPYWECMPGGVAAPCALALQREISSIWQPCSSADCSDYVVGGTNADYRCLWGTYSVALSNCENVIETESLPDVTLTSNRTTVTTGTPTATLTGDASDTLPANYRLALYDNGDYLDTCGSTCTEVVSPDPGETHTYTEVPVFGTPPATLTPLLSRPNVVMGSITIGPDANLNGTTDRILNNKRPKPQIEIAPIVAQQAAQQCLDEMNAMTTPDESKCLSATIFFPGAPAGRAAWNDARALGVATDTTDSGALDTATHYDYAELHVIRYRAPGSSPAKVTPLAEGWGNSYAPCMGNTSVALPCDEYPFYSTYEAGPPEASILPVPQTWNSSEGGSLSAMYRALGCGSTVGAPMADGDPYLVVPLVHTDPGATYTALSGPPTFWLCANAAS